MNVSKMKVGMRLGLGFALVLVLLVAVTVVGILRMAQIQDRLDHVVSVNNVSSRAVIEMRNNVHDRLASLRVLTLMTDATEMEPELKKFKEQTATYTAAQDKVAKIFALEGTTRVMIKEVRPVQKKWTDALDKLVTLEDKQSAESQEEAASGFVSARNFMLAMLVVAVAMGVAAAWVITRGLIKQLGGEPDYTTRIAGSIAHGNLAIAIDTRTAEKGSLLAEMNGMRDSLVDIVSQVRRGTETIGTASREIAAGNIDLSSRTELQASSLEKTASAMETLTTTVRQNAEHAREANHLAASASDVARKGGDVVSQVVGTMGEINSSASKIADIIGVIDGIAFQTNILALNAAVEAARAGEQGRGFAVVASEVRNLAQRSAAAAKEIKTLIGDSVEKVERGSKLVGQAGVTMDEVVASVKRVTDIMGEIANASAEQSAGIEQVNMSIIEMDSMTQQNAALVEEAAAAAQSLQDQAGELSRVVSIFKLAEGEEHSLEPVAPAVAVPVAKLPAVRTPAARPARPALKKPAAPAATAKSKKAPVAAGSDEWEEF
jgi:methyl-accepting chemotaxis protein